MFLQDSYITKLREERRRFAIHNQQLLQSQQNQKHKADVLEDKVRKKNKIIGEKDKKIEQLEEDLEKAKITIDNLKKMLFAAHKHTEVEGDNEEKKEEKEAAAVSKKTRGRKKGHLGSGRRKPERIDEWVPCFLNICPDCQHPLNRSDNFHTHTVTDLPAWQNMKPVTTQYQIEYQWCSHCHKAVSAVPFGVIPGSRIGMTLFLMILIWRYHFRLPFQKISEMLSIQYQLSLTPGAIVGITKKARKFFGKRYDSLLNEIRGAPVKHGDETTWRMDGELFWCWILVTDKVVYYTIEETRGKGVIERLLKDAIGILVCDGYAAYKKLPLLLQACFAHLYRKARDGAARKEASIEAKEFLVEIQKLYAQLQEIIQKPFDKKEREGLYAVCQKKIKDLSNIPYKAQDARKVQTYLRNLGDNLLTAVLYENVSLTNNAAEQAALKIVVGRKISGGSKSTEGTKTHAVNMSIMQTILKQKLPLIPTLQEYLLEDIQQSV
jgi:transposase